MTHWADANDLSILVAFGQAVAFDTVGSSVSANGLFDRQFVDYAGVEGYKPTLQCRTSDVASVARAWTVTIGSDVYTVVGKQDGGTGITLLILEPSVGTATDGDGGDGYGGAKYPEPAV